ncbi:MAG: heme/copper-type cytochrome/quinol oxidase subunit 2 [Candidatus Midichloriaceae bacterium]|jgi:heme/copper-type cytochrome/quinol oxidase subunit 2
MKYNKYQFYLILFFSIFLTVDTIFIYIANTTYRNRKIHESSTNIQHKVTIKNPNNEFPIVNISLINNYDLDTMNVQTLNLNNKQDKKIYTYGLNKKFVNKDINITLNSNNILFNIKFFDKKGNSFFYRYKIFRDNNEYKIK